MHIWAFVSKINQSSNRQPNKKPPGKTEEIQKTVEVPREEHYHRQRVLGGRGRKTTLGELKRAEPITITSLHIMITFFIGLFIPINYRSD